GMGTGGRLTVEGSSQQQGASVQASQAAGPSSNPAANANMSVRDAQIKLNALGYKVGAADGQLGRGTVAQIRAFQRDRRLTVNGQLDQATMNELAK
ncbi:MAG TPA: peptidoglycan-binding domain-containing protein, partial [Casimicrobium sp.]|nr:peptidoglycan-binding domain-containing protein [Casimicrobium sp.]